MDASDLRREISEYASGVEFWEYKRRLIVGELQELVEREVIPQIAALLPAGFSIDVARTEVGCYSKSGEALAIPDAFRVTPILLYDGKPILGNVLDGLDAQMVAIQQNPRLRELADQYGIEKLTPMAASIQVE